jgi:hypothetical protein
MTTSATPEIPHGQYPECPSRDHLPLIREFITPGADFPSPHALDASISLDVFDPAENYERVRVVEIDEPFLIEVNWCVCGPFAALIAGCWEISLYLKDVDGVGKSSGQLGSTQMVDTDTVAPVSGGNGDVDRRCYSQSFTVKANTVKVGAYSLLAIITLRTGNCSDPKLGPRILDVLGAAQIPVLVFIPNA